MAAVPERLRQLSIGSKLSLLLIALTSVGLAALTFVVAAMATRAFDARGEQEIAARTAQMIKTVDLFQRELRDAAIPLNNLFATLYPKPFALDASRTVDIKGMAAPALLHGGELVDLDFTVVDRFTAATGGVATVFARQGDDFIRVATSLKKENGERAVGTLLGKVHPAYAKVIAGEPYAGRARLFGRDYMTRYLPVKASSGEVIAILFTARDFTASLNTLQQTIGAEKFGRSGYFYVIDSRPGSGFGNFIVHPTRTGQNGLGIKDSVTGDEFIKSMLERKRGRVDFALLDSTRGDTSPQRKFAVFDHYPDWDWLIVGTGFVDELTQGSNALRDRVLLIGAALLLLQGVVVVVAIRRMVQLPLASALALTEKVAEGDLTGSIATVADDELGHLHQGLDRMQQSLRRVVGEIHGSAEAISAAAQQIAAGNADLARRTETDAAHLEETASSMEAIASTVRQNADHAHRANTLAIGASAVAVRGGQVVGDVVATMSAISASSRKIADIIGVIDGIAFQTNILALNAAVEAARAGDQGRGFAVVAAEVRSLAQRSASAAKEIKELIDASVANVESGAQQVAAAGETMDEVVTSVKRVTDLVAAISAASNEQSAGIDEVREAVAQLDRATQQNATLVEQASGAARALEEQAQTMVAHVASFTTGEAPPATRVANEVLERIKVSSREAIRPDSARLLAAASNAASVRGSKPAAGDANRWSEF
jgi:methyl-accepting chemotaxis protein-2 (aspartate sensor receptor)